jgi:transcriptional regulator with GAF, ATPase, and Fis domain
MEIAVHSENDFDHLKNENNKLAILYEIALTVVQSLDLKTILDTVLEKVINFLGVDSGVIYVVDDETMEMVPVSFRNLSPETIEDLSRNRVKLGECLCGNIAKFDQEIIITHKASQDPRINRKTLQEEGMEFYAGLPLRAKGKVVGVLCAITHTPYSIEAALLEILRAATVPIGLVIENAQLFNEVKEEALSRRCPENGSTDFDEVITCSFKMQNALQAARKVLNTPTSVLLYGESGTGKELIARGLHNNSFRYSKPFVVVNCAALTESLLESELFGHVKGAFTGAISDKKGLLESAEGGTLFLDEVNSIPLNLQLKLLRFLQERTISRVGSTLPISLDVRVIAASNQPLEEAVAQGTFREDLYYRLNVLKIDIPPLRERKEDIPLLTRYFIHKMNKKLEKNIRGISDDALMLLIDHMWPGNVRELSNTIESAVVMAENSNLDIADLPPHLCQPESQGCELTLEEATRKHLIKVLVMTKGKKKEAARLLGIDPSTLWRKIKSLNIQTG